MHVIHHKNSGVIMLRRFVGICMELLVLGLSAVFIYLEQLFRLLVPRQGKSLEEEVILVTGSANGLGREICRELVKYKGKLVLWDVSETENRSTAEELRNLGAEHVFMDTVDVSDKSQVARAADKVRREVGQVTILVNNAGICPMQQFLELTQEAVQSTFQTNVLSHFWTLSEFLPEMVRANRGHIVTVCSTMGQMAVRGPAPYYATKHAVHGLVECLKDELAHMPNKCDVKFTTAYPFFIKTRMVQGSNSGLHLKFKFPSITPFMEASEVAVRIVEGIRQENEFLYIPETFRIYLAGKFFLPSKLHRIFVDFFVDESGYSVQLGTSNGSNANCGSSAIQTTSYDNPLLIEQSHAATSAKADKNSFTSLLNFSNFENHLTSSAVSAAESWSVGSAASNKMREKEK